MSKNNGNSTPLDELIELIGDVDDSIVSETERAQLIREVRSNGISVSNRAKLATIFSAQAKQLQADVAEQSDLIAQVRKGVEQAGALSTLEEVERDATLAEASKEIEAGNLEFVGTVKGIEREILGSEEDATKQGEEVEKAALRKSLQNGDSAVA